MPTVDVNDTTLYFDRAGDGPAILFVHGMCGDADVWADQARRLEDRYTCVRYDRRGHSRSARGEEAAVSDSLHADDAAALIGALDLAPCLLVGSSGGAAIAVEVALRYPQLLRAAVCSEPPLFCLDRDAGQAVMNEVVPHVEKATADGGLRAGVDAFFSLLCPGLWAILDEDRKDRYRDNADIGFTDLRSPSLGATPDDLASVRLPVLVLAGDRSHPSLRSVTHRLASVLTDARFVELADCGHVTYAEQPDAFAEAVSAFAAETDARKRRAAREAGEQADRFEVGSSDGTSLAVWVEGSGPPLVLVHGSIADHTTFGPFVEVLRDNWTTYSMDRRGFGASGDSPPYSIERDFEDVAAVVDAVAARTGESVALWGHSYGANCAMGGTARTTNVHHLVLYEPSLGLAYPPGAIEGIEQALAAGDNEAAIVAVLADILEMTDAEIDALRTQPLWPVRLAAAPTVPRECRAEEGWTYQPGQFDAIGAPTLLLTGSDSVPVVAKATHVAAGAIGHAQLRVLEGHGHFAHKTDPAMVAAIIGDFVAT
jgi:pimeloyl-ACP methyl ester carboxylesterase